MTFQEFLPPPALQPFIYHYAILEDHRENPNGLTECSPPNLCTGLLFYYRRESPVIITNGVYDAALPQNFILPQCMLSHHWLYHKQISIFAIMFKPGKLRHFFPYPLLEYQDRVLPISDCGEKRLLELEQRILEAKNTYERIQASNDFLLQRLRCTDPYMDLIDRMLKQLFVMPGSHINELALGVKISDRHFRRLFEREVGLSPKAWQKLARFTQAMQMLQRGDFNKLSDVAYACGYYDQTQFINQFKYFTQVTPAQFLKEPHPITELTAHRAEVVDKRLLQR